MTLRAFLEEFYSVLILDDLEDDEEGQELKTEIEDFLRGPLI